MCFGLRIGCDKTPIVDRKVETNLVLLFKIINSYFRYIDAPVLLGILSISSSLFGTSIHFLFPFSNVLSKKTMICKVIELANDAKHHISFDLLLKVLDSERSEESSSFTMVFIYFLFFMFIQIFYI